jgi:gliding motility associated protien GldN
MKTITIFVSGILTLIQRLSNLAKGYRRIALVCCQLIISNAANAQSILTGDSGPFPTKESATRMVIPYPPLREADVMWSRRIWSFIDIRQKINHPLYYPLEPSNNFWSLFDIIRYGLTNNWITAYGLGPTQDDDEFRYPLSPSEVEALLNPTVTRFRERLSDGQLEPVELILPLRAEEVTGYLIKEDWIFDKQRSSRQVRLIGLAPVVNVYSESGELKGQKVLFWLYYPECRYLFAPLEVYMGKQMNSHISFDQLFIMRRYSAHIIKEDNVYDRSIEEYAKGMDALMEGERIRQELFNFEHDLWTY